MDFDLVARTEKFGRDSLVFAGSVPINPLTLPIIQQFVRSSTSIGANYCEADCAVSKKDFVYKIGIVRREAKETVYWLKMFLVAVPEKTKEIRGLLNEAEQLCLIFNKIFNSTKENLNKKDDDNPSFDIE